MRRPVILLFGDSITQQGFGMNGNVGWASLLAGDYSRRADVLNRGYFGYNSNHAVALLPSIFGADNNNNNNGIDNKNHGDVTQPLLFCTVYFGANDATVPGSRQHVPLEEYSANLVKIITTIRETCSNGDTDEPTIILMTPPPLDAEAWRVFKELDVSNRSNEMHRRYGLEIKRVAQPYNKCSVLDVWELLEGDASPEVYSKYLTDGLHLNEAGNRKLYQSLTELLHKEYPDLVPQQEGSLGGVPLEERPWDELC